MNLHDALRQLAADFELDETRLIQYADEDEHTGWDYGRGGWPIGSLFQVEGQVLYALIRYLQPESVLELGTYHGCSATHMTTALEVNGRGRLVCVDTSVDAGDLIPGPLRKRVTFAHQEIDSYVDAVGEQFDFIFEDGNHGIPQVSHVWQRATHILKPGGVIVSHDADHFLVGKDIRAGIATSGHDAKIYHPEPADCGLAIWRKPILTFKEVDAVLYSEPEEEIDWLADDDVQLESAVQVQGDLSAELIHDDDEVYHVMGVDIHELDDMSVDELKDLAGDLDIPLRGRPKKETIIQKIRDELDDDS